MRDKVSVGSLVVGSIKLESVGGVLHLNGVPINSTLSMRGDGCVVASDRGGLYSTGVRLADGNLTCDSVKVDKIHLDASSTCPITQSTLRPWTSFSNVVRGDGDAISNIFCDESMMLFLRADHLGFWLSPGGNLSVEHPVFIDSVACVSFVDGFWRLSSYNVRMFEKNPSVSEIFIGGVRVNSLEGVLRVDGEPLRKSHGFDDGRLLTSVNGVIKQTDVMVDGDDIACGSANIEKLALTSCRTCPLLGGDIQVDSSKVVVDASACRELKNIRADDDLVLFLYAGEHSFAIVPGGNVGVDRPHNIDGGSCVSLTKFDGFWRLSSYNNKIDKDSDIGVNELFIGGVPLRSSSGILLMNGKPLKDECNFNSGTLLTSFNGGVARTDIKLDGGGISCGSVKTDSLILNSTQRSAVVNGRISVDQSKVCVDSSMCRDISHIDADDDLVLFLYAGESEFRLIPGGNVGVDRPHRVEFGNCAALNWFFGSWRISSYNTAVVDESTATVGELVVGGSRIHSSLGKLLVDGVPLRCSTSFDGDRLLTCREGVVQQTDIVVGGGAVACEEVRAGRLSVVGWSSVKLVGETLRMDSSKAMIDPVECNILRNIVGDDGDVVFLKPSGKLGFHMSPGGNLMLRRPYFVDGVVSLHNIDGRWHPLWFISNDLDRESILPYAPVSITRGRMEVPAETNNVAVDQGPVELKWIAKSWCGQIIHMRSSAPITLAPGGNLLVDEPLEVSSCSLAHCESTGKWIIRHVGGGSASASDVEPGVVHVVCPWAFDGVMDDRQTRCMAELRKAAAGAWFVEVVAVVKPPCDVEYMARMCSEYGFTLKILPREADNARGLVRLDEILSIFRDSGRRRLVFTNSDCSLSSEYYHKIACSDSLDFIVRNDVVGDSMELYEIGVDGFHMTRHFYDGMLKNRRHGFYVGEPHWDTSLVNLAAASGWEHSFDVVNMTHERHSVGWDCSNLSKYGLKNKKLYDYYRSNHDIAELISIGAASLSVVVVFYGDDEIRTDRLRTCVNMLKRQRHLFELVVVEANRKRIFNSSWYPGNRFFKYKFVEMGDDNMGLWHKEALMNVGWRMASGGNILFLDSDVRCDDPSWLKDVDGVLTRESVFLQPFLHCRDTMFKNVVFVSKVANDSGYSVEGALYNPGLCSGVRKSELELRGGVNPFYPYGCGDSGFYNEYTGGGDSFYDVNRRLTEVRRKFQSFLPRTHTNHDIFHMCHGLIDLEYYRSSISKTLKFPIKMCVELGSNDILRNKMRSEINIITDSKFKNRNIIKCVCPTRMSNKLILLFHVVNHLEFSGNIICFEEIFNEYGKWFPNLEKYSISTKNRQVDKIISFDDLCMDGAEFELVNDKTFKLLELGAEHFLKFESIQNGVNFNSVGVHIRMGDFKSNGLRHWFVPPEEYIYGNIDFISNDEVYAYSDGDPKLTFDHVMMSSERTGGDPVMDLLLLSKHRRMIRNGRSSYGWLASMIGKYRGTLKDVRVL